MRFMVHAEAHGLRHLEQPIGRRYAEGGANYVPLVACTETFERMSSSP